MRGPLPLPGPGGEGSGDIWLQGQDRTGYQVWADRLLLWAGPSSLPSLPGLPGSEHVQAGWEVLVKQNGEVGSLGLHFPLVNPAAHGRAPPQVCRVDVQDSWGHREC